MRECKSNSPSVCLINNLKIKNIIDNLKNLGYIVHTLDRIYDMRKVCKRFLKDHKRSDLYF